jgi:hypothetical protein
METSYRVYEFILCFDSNGAWIAFGVGNLVASDSSYNFLSRWALSQLERFAGLAESKRL